MAYVYCTRCDTANREDAGRCQSCGHSLGSGDQPAPANAPPKPRRKFPRILAIAGSVVVVAIIAGFGFSGSAVPQQQVTTEMTPRLESHRKMLMLIGFMMSSKGYTTHDGGPISIDDIPYFLMGHRFLYSPGSEKYRAEWRLTGDDRFSSFLRVKGDDQDEVQWRCELDWIHYGNLIHAPKGFYQGGMDTLSELDRGKESIVERLVGDYQFVATKTPYSRMLEFTLTKE